MNYCKFLIRNNTKSNRQNNKESNEETWQEILKSSHTTTKRFTSHVFAVLQLCSLRMFLFILGRSTCFEALNFFSSFLAKQLEAVILIKSKLACPAVHIVKCSSFLSFSSSTKKDRALIDDRKKFVLQGII